MPISGQALEDFSAIRYGHPGPQIEEGPCHDLIGGSAATRRLQQKIDRIGPHFRTLVLRGEIGTGKEMVARALHARGGGTWASFVHCHGAAIDTGEDMTSHSPWCFIETHCSGTLFLDGVDEIPLQAQSRLFAGLHTLPHGRNGLKVIAATRQDLERMVSTRRFRSDLYHHLATIEIEIAPLRKRCEDIAPLAQEIVRRFSVLYGKDDLALADETLEMLEEHNWPGNVRELENALRNGVLSCDEDVLEPRHINIVALTAPTGDTGPDSERAHVTRLQDVVDRHVLNVLGMCSGNKVRAAELLGISRSTLYRMLESPAMRGASSA
ncbi:MAG: sigma-54-dependent Fis family transcriptional regulator [Acidobacteria bacterium]|nr:sigma-54-dependent Fis family transcriptional regulator [Acidobacteriota bacterium]